MVMGLSRSLIKRSGMDVTKGSGLMVALAVNVIGSMTAGGINC